MGTPYSSFVKFNDLVFISGQVGAEATSGVISEGFEAQAKNVFENLKLRLSEAGLTTDEVLKTTVFLTDLSYFDKMNAMYAEFFGEHKPARTTVGVKDLPQFPGDPTVFIEIEAIAGK